MSQSIIRIMSAYSCQTALFTNDAGAPVDLRSAVKQRDMDAVLEAVFSEQTPYKTLLRDYQSFSNGAASDYFARMYEINETYGVVLDAHITLYKLDPAMIRQQAAIIPWRYPIASMYLADTWWFSDEEILEDLVRLSLIDFIEKYKAII